MPQVSAFSRFCQKCYNFHVSAIQKRGNVMEKILYLMRHGQTLFNLEHKIQGWCDSPLTELGIAQAKIAGRYFTDNKIKLDHCYASTSPS